MSAGYSMRTYNAAGVFMERHRPDATAPDSPHAERELRELGIRINGVRGQKTWRSDLYRDGHRIASCKNGRWVEHH